MPPVTDSLVRLVVAVLVGLLIGLDRERAEVRKARQIFAGIRTLPLIALAGAIPALMLPRFGPAPLAVSFAIVGVLIVAAYLKETAGGHVGATTEIAAVVTFLLGTLAGTGELLLAGGCGIAVATLLFAKPGLERFSRALSQEEITATLELAILSGIVLPLLPNRGFGPWQVLNPFDIWLVVVMVSALSFAGFVAMRVVGRERGTLYSGVLGALVSSTAVTLAMAERSRDDPALSRPAARSTVLASAVMCARVGAVAAALGPGILPRLLPVLASMTLVALAGARLLRHDDAAAAAAAGTSPGNPFRLSAAITFAGLYAAVLLVVRAASEWLGQTGIYVAAALSSLVDLDAVTIAFARGGPGPGGWRGPAAAVALGIVINTIVKLALAAFVGSREFSRFVVSSLGLMVATGATAGWAVWAFAG